MNMGDSLFLKDLALGHGEDGVAGVCFVMVVVGMLKRR